MLIKILCPWSLAISDSWVQKLIKALPRPDKESCLQFGDHRSLSRESIPQNGYFTFGLRAYRHRNRNTAVSNTVFTKA
jgi:hypothetical protein